MTENRRMLAGLLYNPFLVESSWNIAREAVKRFNDSEFWKNDDALRELKKIFAAVGEDVVLTPPFYCDHGSKITLAGKVAFWVFAQNISMIIDKIVHTCS